MDTPSRQRLGTVICLCLKRECLAIMRNLKLYMDYLTSILDLLYPHPFHQRQRGSETQMGRMVRVQRAFPRAGHEGLRAARHGN